MPPFRPAWWLPNAHTLTLWGRLGRHEPALPLRPEQLETPDGDFIELAHLDIANTTPNTPRLLILHGLEGHIDSHYVRGLMREATARGWNATLQFFRTCGPTPNRRPRSYHSGETSDKLFVIQKIVREHPNAPLGMAGISLGGNVLCKLLGEQGEQLAPAVRAAVAISTPFDLARASRHIGRGFGKIYEWSFLRSLIPKALAKIARHPELHALTNVANVTTLWEFDDAFTAPLHGFADAADYYAQSSSLSYLHNIRRPTLLLSAIDDPFLPRAVLDDVRRVADANAVLELEFTPRGGHVGFVAGTWPWRPFYYGEWRTAQFIEQQFAPPVAERCQTPHSTGASSGNSAASASSSHAAS